MDANIANISNVSNLRCNESFSMVLLGCWLVNRFLVLVPLSTFVIYLGYKQWRRQSSFRSSSHNDIFTYNMAAVELLCEVGTIFYLYGMFSKHPTIIFSVGPFLFVFNFKGMAFFYILTCVERYLAVVHPITYMRLRNARGVLIRNLSIGCAWLVGLLWSYFVFSDRIYVKWSLLCVSAVSLVIVSFCSVSVLCVLIRPGPGEGGGNKGSGNQMKQRAFFTIMAIMVVLLLWFFGFVITTVPNYRTEVDCVVQVAGLWFNLPGSVVSPVLYLHRNGRLSCCFRQIFIRRGPGKRDREQNDQ